MLSNYIYTAFLFAIAAYALAHFRTLKPAYKVIAGLLILTFVTETVGLIMLLKKKDNTLFYHYFTLIEYSLFCRYFWYINKRTVFRRLSAVSVFLFFLFSSAVYFFQLTNIPVGSNYDFLIEAVLLIIFAVSYLIMLYKNPSETEMWKSPEIWVTLGIVFFFSLNFLLFGFFEYLRETFKSNQELFYFINHLGNYILYSFLIKAISCREAKMK